MTALGFLPHGIADRLPRFRSSGARWSVLLTAVCATLLISYLLIAALIALVVGTADGPAPSTTEILATSLPAWLAAYQVPLSLSGAPLSALPLLPTVLLVVLVAGMSRQVARRSRLRQPNQARWLIAVMGGGHAVVGTGVAVLVDGPVFGDRVAAAPLEAFLYCGIVATVGTVIGTLDRCGLTYLVWERVDSETWAGLRAGLLGAAGALAAGSLVVSGAVCRSLPEMHDVSVRSGSLGNGLGLTVVSILYLPNAVLGGWSFAAGPGISLGKAVIRPFELVVGPLPDVPLLAAVPRVGPAVWWSVTLVLPLLVGALVGWFCRNAHPYPQNRLHAVAVAAGAVSVVIAVLAAISGGRLGAGPFSPVAVPGGFLTLATFCWIAVPGALVAWFVGGHPPDIGGEEASVEPVESTEHAEPETASDSDSEPEPEVESAVNDKSDSPESESESEPVTAHDYLT